MVVWDALNSPRLPAVARQRIANASAVYISAVSLWEIGMKVSAGKLKLSMSELRTGAEMSASIRHCELNTGLRPTRPR
jgi:PIN domain nuclease of toxin-antitoxin system